VNCSEADRSGREDVPLSSFMADSVLSSPRESLDLSVSPEEDSLAARGGLSSLVLPKRSCVEDVLGVLSLWSQSPGLSLCGFFRAPPFLLFVGMSVEAVCSSCGARVLLLAPSWPVAVQLRGDSWFTRVAFESYIPDPWVR
jgi:hypothetical protein